MHSSEHIEPRLARRKPPFRPLGRITPLSESEIEGPHWQSTGRFADYTSKWVLSSISPIRALLRAFGPVRRSKLGAAHLALARRILFGTVVGGTGHPV